LVVGPGDEIATVGSTGRKPWPGDATGVGEPPCQDERGRRLSGCAVLHAHILRTVLPVMFLILWRVAAAEFVGGTITQTSRAFPQKIAGIGEEIVNERGSSGRGFFRNPDAVRLAHRSASSPVGISEREGSASDRKLRAAQPRSKAESSCASQESPSNKWPPRIPECGKKALSSQSYEHAHRNRGMG
jgi:hypothetical protein